MYKAGLKLDRASLFSCRTPTKVLESSQSPGARRRFGPEVASIDCVGVPRRLASPMRTLLTSDVPSHAFFLTNVCLARFGSGNELNFNSELRLRTNCKGPQKRNTQTRYPPPNQLKRISETFRVSPLPAAKRASASRSTTLGARKKPKEETKKRSRN